MKTKDLILRCYAEKMKDGSYFAFCLDLNLYAYGDSIVKARDKLTEIIHQYLRDAFTEDEKYFADLVPRKAPLYFWIKYYSLIVASKFNRPTRCPRSGDFLAHLPLKPA